MMGHGRALDLAATAIDFDLSPIDRSALRAHLASCAACRADAAAMRLDAERLRDLRPVAPPAWVAHSIGRRSRPTALVLAFVILALTGALAAAVAGSLTAPPTRVDTSPSSTVRPSPGSYPAVLLNTAIRVAAPGIVLRQVPSATGTEIARAGQGAILATDGALRVRADGFDWYHAVVVSEGPSLPALPSALRGAPGASGWIAVRSATDQFATPLEPRCPTGTRLEDVAPMLEAERLACFGGATIEVRGVFTCPTCNGTVSGVYEPVWLAASSSAALVVSGVGSGPSLVLHFPPDGPAVPGEGTSISARGHFDDAAAATCHLALAMPGDPEATISPVDTESVVLLCRQAFVVESYEVTAAP